MKTSVYSGDILRVGNSQGVRIPLGALQESGFYEEFLKTKKMPVQLEVCRDSIIIHHVPSKPTIDFLLEGYDEDDDRYDWGELNEAKGREIW